MRFYYSLILFVFSILAYYFSTRILYKKKKEKHNVAFSVAAFGSGTWSLGYAMMLYYDNEAMFLIARMVGILGLFTFILSVQYMIGIVANLSKRNFYYFHFETIVGIIVLILVSAPSSVTLELTENGIVTQFKNSFMSIFYTLYTLWVAISICVLSIKITNKKFLQHIRVFGRNLLQVLAIIFVGMIIDTILPAFGINFNIPASTIMQFLGLEIAYYAVHRIDRNRLSFQNMTGYMYMSLKTPILVFNRDNKLNIVNNSAKEIFDIGIDDEIDKINFWNNILPIDAPGNIDNIIDTVIVDSYYAKKDMHCRIYIDPISDEYKDVIGYIVMISDITELVNNAKALEDSREEALRATKAKSQFLANMSHEIRTPMNSIIGFSELALSDSINDTSREHFEDINRSAHSLLTIINDILDISKIESGKMEVINADYPTDEVFKDVSRVIKMQAYRKKIEFQFEIEEGFPNVLYGDRVKVRAMLVNLLNNGIKYTKEGYVRLKGSHTKLSDDECMLHFEISDSGIGIKEDDLANIFTMFQRVDEKVNNMTEGTGLGLSITKGYAELMGGSITVKSKYGQGTTFVLEFKQKIIDETPLDVKDTANKVNENKKLKLQNVKILAVDDIDMNIKLLELIMANYGVNIDTCLSGKEALEKCKNNQYDLIFMDQMMPELDGIETMKEIRKLEGFYQSENYKVVVLTANAIDGAKDKLIEMGFDDYLSKPIDIPNLEKVLKKILPEDKIQYV